MTNETNKVAIVTGASRGIGAAVAERLAADGFTVVINYSGDTKSAEAMARKIEGKGGQALTAKADVSDPNAVRGMFDAAQAAFGGVDVLVNNAGIMKLARIKGKFLKGFLVIESEIELDVVAVYTAAGAEGQVESLHTERVPPRRRKTG